MWVWLAQDNWNYAETGWSPASGGPALEERDPGKHGTWLVGKGRVAGGPRSAWSSPAARGYAGA